MHLIRSKSDLIARIWFCWHSAVDCTFGILVDDVVVLQELGLMAASILMSQLGY